METKIEVIMPYRDADGNIQIENLLVIEKGQYYQVKSIPFFVEHLSFDDLIDIVAVDGEIRVDDLIEKSGNSTIHLVFFDIHKVVEVIKKLEQMGCVWEEYENNKYFSVNVPQAVSYTPIRKYLDQCLEQNIADYKESDLNHDDPL